jgi:hypothetical protein
MEQKTKSVRVATIPALYDMQTTFFTSSLEGISDSDAHLRLDTKANHIAWLAGLLLNTDDEQLDGNIEMPGMTFPLFDMITFVTYREANCIGQVALWRRLLGYEAMKYM